VFRRNLVHTLQSDCKLQSVIFGILPLSFLSYLMFFNRGLMPLFQSARPTCERINYLTLKPYQLMGFEALETTTTIRRAFSRLPPLCIVGTLAAPA